MNRGSNQSTRPHRWADQWLEWFCAPHLFEEIQGDLHEELAYQVERIGERRARWRYIWDVLGFVRPFVLKRTASTYSAPPFLNPSMIRNYVKIAWRNITRYKVYTLINVLGLALGISSCLSIFAITQFELSFDSFHPDKERIYRIVAQVQEKSLVKEEADNVPTPSPAAIREEMSGLEKVAGFLLFYPRVTIPTQSHRKGNRIDEGVKKFNNAKFCQIIIAEPQYFDILKYTWLVGNARTALRQPFQVVLTENRARQYFGAGALDQMIGNVVVYGYYCPTPKR